MSNVREYAAFAVAVGATLLALAILVLPAALPFPEVAPFDMGLSVAVVVTLAVAVRAFIGERRAHSDLDESPAESVTRSASTVAAAELRDVHDQALAAFDDAGRVERRVAMYGRRTTRVDDVPDAVDTAFDELAVTARDVIATATGSDLDAATHAVARGAWTDDRQAAAFLAVDLAPAATFTLRERLAGWLAPRATFERRLERTLATVEAVAGDAYLTYDAASEPQGSPADDGGELS